jgi:hypothetical protein
MKINSKPAYGEKITPEGNASTNFQLYLDDLEERLNTFLLGDAVKIPSYAKASLPSAANNFETGESSSLIYVTDDVGGAVVAFTDGTDWRRVTDRAVIS